MLEQGVQMRSISWCGAALLCLISTAASAQQVKWVLETLTVTDYELSDVGKIAYHGPGQQTSLTASYGSCFGNIWNWRAFSDGHGFNPSEIDYNLGCKVQLGGIDLNLGVSYFDLPKQFKSLDDEVQGFIGLGKSFVNGSNTFTVSADVKPNFPLGSNSGLYSEFGFVDQWKAMERLTLVFSGRLLNDTGAFGNTPGWNARGDVTAIVALKPGALDWKVGVRGLVPLSKFDNPADPRKDSVFGYTGLTTRF